MSHPTAPRPPSYRERRASNGPTEKTAPLAPSYGAAVTAEAAKEADRTPPRGFTPPPIFREHS